MHETISMNFLILQGFLERGRINYLKKKRNRAGGVGSEPGRPKPGGLPGWLSRTGMVGARLVFLAR
jgi:hypothetical protein